MSMTRALMAMREEQKKQLRKAKELVVYRKLDEALKVLETLWIALNDRRVRTEMHLECCLEIGKVLFKKRRYEEAMSYLKEGEKMPGEWRYDLRMEILDCISWTALRLDDGDEEEKARLQKMAYVSRFFGPRSKIMIVELFRIGWMYINASEPEKALKNFRKAVRIYEDTGVDDGWLIGHLSHGLAVVLEYMDRKKEAWMWLQRALFECDSFPEEIKDNEERCRMILRLARFLKRRKWNPDTEQYLNQAFLLTLDPEFRNDILRQEAESAFLEGIRKGSRKN